MPLTGSPLALQTIMDVLGNPATAWVIIPILIFSIPIISTLTAPFAARYKAAERQRLQQMYERLALEKLDVIKTAVTMGYQRDDLRELDARLEEVIGSEAMRALLEGASSRSKGPRVTIDVDTSKLGSSKTLDLNELISSELGEGLSKRRRERSREKNDDD